MNVWLRYLFLCVSTLLLVSGKALAEGTIADLAISLSAEKPIIVGEQDIFVRVRISNETNEAIFVPQLQLPQSEFSTPLFSIVAADGRAAPYVGAMVKWAPEALKKSVKFAPNTHRDYLVELSKSYLFRSGAYRIEYVGIGFPPTGTKTDTQAPSRKKLSSPIIITVQDRASINLNEVPRSVLGENKVPPDPANDRLTPKLSIAYSFCSARQIKSVRTAATAALAYAKNSYSYLRSKTPASATARYLTWFGYPENLYWLTAYDHFSRIYAALYFETISFDCSCNADGVFAYVYRDDPYNIYLCNSFWSAPTKGTDSKAGTIIHEMSHFSILGGTEDWVYGQSDARSLARSYPDYAVTNADNHEYFAENKPQLR